MQVQVDVQVEFGNGIWLVSYCVNSTLMLITLDRLVSSDLVSVRTLAPV